MIDLTIRQALDVWAELEDAYQGVAAYGSDTAEIYAYRLQTRRPVIEAASRDSDLWQEANREMAEQAGQNLWALCCEFEARRNCAVWIDGVRASRWKTRAFDWRVEVKVCADVAP